MYIKAPGVTFFPNFRATRFQSTAGLLWRRMSMSRCFSAPSSQTTREEEEPVGMVADGKGFGVGKAYWISGDRVEV